jgi:hypothetical protein
LNCSDIEDESGYNYEAHILMTLTIASNIKLLKKKKAKEKKTLEEEFTTP